MQAADRDRSRESVHEAYDRPGARRFGARDALVCVLVAALLLALLEGPSIRRSGEQMDRGIQRTMVLAVGKPFGWVGDRLGLARISHDATAWLSPDADLGDQAGFANVPAAGRSGGVPVVTPDAFDPVALGGKPLPHRPLRTLLVTGDSLATPLDNELARKLSGRPNLKVIREPHLGTGISKSLLVDWGKLSAQQTASDKPDAIVVFIGANEGFAMPGPGGRDVACCGAAYAAVFANRVRRMMDTYRQRGAARVYWLTLPTPRDRDRQDVARTVNAAIEVAAQPFRSQVRIFDTVPVFTPGGRYRDAMDIAGVRRIVRESDGIHLNEAGASLAADRVLKMLASDFGPSR
jgi:lysophospholipase L1-like esterase